jgi:dihydroflavonol-4-reductase
MSGRGDRGDPRDSCAPGAPGDSCDPGDTGDTGDNREGARHDLAEEVLVTGASGFLGRPLVAALAAAGRQVTGFARRPAAAATAEPDSVRWVYGDIRCPRTYLPHLRPGIAVYHLAALRSAAGRRRGDLEAVNVAACRDLARHCLERGVRRFVLVATAHLYGPSVRGTPHREDDGPPAAGSREAFPGAGGEPALGCYERTRGAALLAVRRLAAEGLDAVTLCPAILFGPDSPAHPNRVTGELRRILRRRRPVVILIAGGTARRELVHVDDVVGAALAAERLAPPGAELLLGGEAISHRELVERSLALAGRRPRHLTLSIPGSAALLAARAADRLLRHDPGCGHAAAVLRSLQEWRFDSGLARRLLGYRPRPLDAGLAMTLRWLRGEEGAADPRLEWG